MNNGAYSPSTGQQFSTVKTNLSQIANGVNKTDPDRLILLWRPNDFNSGEDRLYFIVQDTGTPNAQYYYSSAFNSTPNSGAGRGGISITIRNSGSFDHFQNTPTNSQILDNGTVEVDSTLQSLAIWISGGNRWFEIPPNAPQTVNAGTNEGASGESIEWNKNTGRNVWDNVSIGLNQGGNGDCGYFVLNDVSCDTIIQVELMFGHSIDIFSDGLVVGEANQINSWYVPQSGENNAPKEIDGDGNHAFVLIHPQTGQFIANDNSTTNNVSINDYPSDLVFYGAECPYNIEQRYNAIRRVI